MSIGDRVVLDDGRKGLIQYIGKKGHLGIGLEDGTFTVVRPEDVRRG